MTGSDDVSQNDDVTGPTFRDVTCRDDLKALSRYAGIPEKELVVIARDPFATGTDAHWEKARWVAAIVEKYKVDIRAKHARGLHYVILSHGESKPDGSPYEGTGSSDEELLTKSIGYARELGLLPWDAFEDRKSTVYADTYYLRDYFGPDATVTVPAGYVPTVDPFDAYAKPWDVTFSRPSELGAQPVLVEVLTEKAGIAPQLATVTNRYGCRLVVTEGFSSKARAAAIVRSAIADGRPRVVLSFHDADSSGESMPNATARHLEFLVRTLRKSGEDVPPIYFKPVALTLAQLAGIEERIGRSIPLAPDVGRAEGRVELDALPEFAPGWLEDELDRHLRALYAEVDFSALEDAEAGVELELADEFVEVQGRMSQIVDQARAVLDTPEARELRAKLVRLAAEMSDATDEATEIAEGFVADLPDPDIAEIDFGAIDWLLDTDRDYLEQLEAYRRFEPEHRRRAPIGDVVERRCAGCDGPMTHRRSNASFCSDECKYERLKRDRRMLRATRRGAA